jgi:hypothetical protein
MEIYSFSSPEIKGERFGLHEYKGEPLEGMRR